MEEDDFSKTGKIIWGGAPQVVKIHELSEK